MSPLEFVDVATARNAPGVRLVVSGLVPSPWSEAAKGVFAIAGVPVIAVRRMRDGADIAAWTGIDNVPVVVYGAEPVRTHWAAITSLAARLGPGTVLPEDVAGRADMMGVLHEIAGEEGLGWNARLAMIDATLTSRGARGFPLPVGERLAARYGYTPEAVRSSRERAKHQLDLLETRLREQRALGHDYLGGSSVSALDVFAATFLTPLSEILPEDCPALAPVLRQAFGCAHEALGALVPAALTAHRGMMFQRHLTWPIPL
jgi:glutathione S-transferase